MLRNIPRFCLLGHIRRVETTSGRWQIHNRHCDVYDLHDVQDETHDLLIFMPLLGNVPFEKEICKTICWFH